MSTLVKSFNLVSHHDSMQLTAVDVDLCTVHFLTSASERFTFSLIAELNAVSVLYYICARNVTLPPR